MKKVTKRFEFDMPLSKTFYRSMEKTKSILMGTLEISYIGYDYKISLKDQIDDDEDRFDVDIDFVNFEGKNIIDILKSDLFEDVLREIEQAAMNDVAYQFEEYELAKRHLEHDEY